ncbi:hypothetical protein RRF68_06165 [Tenacibaculum sp. HL-MS23]|uniref:hypothetical protein n=1 Tax=Tenacibaculum sp. HL-MS23 TaxID=3077734 RepID=UPI0028FC2A8D|nr:hypothetical protein [Tenacibaculum sp. HL-MS23]WNW02980.1 hypothetical protein RRF68_06165 [Tenacibaculum sp. HL-MS23]
MKQLSIYPLSLSISKTNTTVPQATLVFSAEKRISENTITVTITNGETVYKFTSKDLNKHISVGTITNGSGYFKLIEDKNLNVYVITFSGYVVNATKGTVNNAIVAYITGKLPS